jgi:hypothetical protein
MANADRSEESSTEEVDMIIHVAKGHDLHAVAQLLREAGVSIDRELTRSRLVGGKGPRSLLEKLPKIAGVKMIRQAETFSLPPFDESVPQ